MQVGSIKVCCVGFVMETSVTRRPELFMRPVHHTKAVRCLLVNVTVHAVHAFLLRACSSFTSRIQLSSPTCDLKDAVPSVWLSYPCLRDLSGNIGSGSAHGISTAVGADTDMSWSPPCFSLGEHFPRAHAAPMTAKCVIKTQDCERKLHEQGMVSNSSTCVVRFT